MNFLLIEYFRLLLPSVFWRFANGNFFYSLQICKESKGKKVQPEKIQILVKKYVKNCLEINEKNKERMRNLLDRKVNKEVNS